MKRYLHLLLVVILVIPTFWQMLKPGIYSMQDFHYFRLVEFDKCVRDLQIPCRWSADAGLGYGEPLFNFYGQVSYIPGEIIHLLGVPFTESLKLTFIFSLVASALAMFFLSRKIWASDWAGVVSAILYVYAPYRAVDVWVRGALPEAMSFVLFPLILLFFEDYINKNNKRHLLLFSLSLALLILTHNLSVILFAPVLLIWIPYRLYVTRKITLSLKLTIAIILSLGISAFYLLPVVFESKYINLESTTLGYFNFRGHFDTLSQILTSRFWGYGGSVFGPEDGLNLSVGLVQWIAPLVALFICLLTNKFKKFPNMAILILIGWICLLLTHNKSTLLWESLDFMKYIQFPWRFLGIAVFAFALAAGALISILKKWQVLVTIVLLILAIALNINYFKEDIWYYTNDAELTSEERWIEQTRASIGDFWPKASGEIPVDFAPSSTTEFELIKKSSNKSVYKLLSDDKNVDFPINDFPGWVRSVDGDNVIFEFRDTTIRTVGNAISLISAGIFVYLYAK